MGALVALALRSESTMMLAPSAIASDTWPQTFSSAASRPGPAPGDGEQAVDGEALEARRLAVLVDIDELGEVVVVDDRVRERDLPAGLGLGLEQVALGPDGRLERGHELLADGVEGRVRHLREELGEVVVQEPRAAPRARRAACPSPSSRSARSRCAPWARR